MSKVLILMLLLPGIVQAQSAALLVYKVWERGIDPYISRILVTPEYVRMDEGNPDGAYTLFDRQQEIIYSVSTDDRSVLVVNPGNVGIKPQVALLFSEKRSPDSQAPKVAGITPVDIELMANGELCAKISVLPGLMEQALEGLRELKQVLARAQAATLAGRPDELQTPCDLATHIHAPTRALDYGLPIQEQSGGQGQVLQDFSAKHPVDAGLFEIPQGYARMAMPAAASE